MVSRLADMLLDRSVLFGYSKLGHRLRASAWDSTPPDALAGRTIAVTGANAGLGLATALGAASLGANVRLLCRDTGRGAAAREVILRSHPHSVVVVDQCDVSSFASVRSAAATLADSLGSLHGLVHNAGVMPPARSKSADGHELALATHVLGPHLLTSLLRPLLVADGDARVLFVSSGGMYPQKLWIDDPEFQVGEYRPAVAYARTKRMQVVLAELWARELAGTGVSVHSMHPGWAATPGVTESLPTFEKVMRPLLRSAAEGADTSVWLMHSAEAGETTGRFWHDRAARPTDLLPWTRSTDADKQELWDFCEKAVGA